MRLPFKTPLPLLAVAIFFGILAGGTSATSIDTDHSRCELKLETPMQQDS